MNPQECARHHTTAMDQLVPAIIKGADLRYVYQYVLRYAIGQKLVLPKDSGRFLRSCARLRADIKDPHLLSKLSVSDSVKRYLTDLRAIRGSFRPESAVDTVTAHVRRLRPPHATTELERVLVDYSGPLAIASAGSIQKYVRTRLPMRGGSRATGGGGTGGGGEPSGTSGEGNSGEGGVDTGEILDADLTGLILGAAGAAIGTFWSGPVTAGPVAGGAVTGALLGSAVEYLEQDAISDTLKAAAKVSSSADGGGDVWDDALASAGDGEWAGGDGSDHPPIG